MLPLLLIAGVDHHPSLHLPSLPHLHRALQHWLPGPLLRSNAAARLTPAERVRSQWLQLPGDPAQPPLAALAHGRTGTGCAWFVPCHVQLNMDHALLDDPQDLQLDATDSQALMAALVPLFAQEGIELHYESPLRWYAEGELLRHAPWISPAQGQRLPLRIDRLAPDSAQQPPQERKRLQRLLNEVQMLLYTHPVTDARAARRLPAVNAVWLHGAGALDAWPGPALDLETAAPIDTRLVQAAEAGPAGWARAWADWDTALAAQLDALRTETGERPPTLALCGEHAALTLTPLPPSWSMQRLMRRLRPLRLSQLLATVARAAEDEDHADAV